MRLLLLLVTVCLALSQAAFAQEMAPLQVPALPPELVKLKETFAKAEAEIQAAAKKRRTQLKSDYLGGVENLQKQATQKGNLDAALAARGEGERIRQGRETTAEQRKTMSPEQLTWRGRYDLALGILESDWSKAEGSVRAKYLQDLQALQVDFTKRGKIEEALAVKREREAQLSPTPSVAAVTPPIASATKPSANSEAAAPRPVGGPVQFFGVTIDPGSTRPGSPVMPSSTPVPPAAGPGVPIESTAPRTPVAPMIPSPAADPSTAELESKVIGIWDISPPKDRPKEKNFLTLAPGGKTQANWNKGTGYWRPIGSNEIEFTMGGEKETRHGTFSADFKEMHFPSLDKRGALRTATFRSR